MIYFIKEIEYRFFANKRSMFSIRLVCSTKITSEEIRKLNLNSRENITAEPRIDGHVLYGRIYINICPPILSFRAYIYSIAQNLCSCICHYRFFGPQNRYAPLINEFDICARSFIHLYFG